MLYRTYCNEIFDIFTICYSPLDELNFIPYHQSAYNRVTQAWQYSINHRSIYSLKNASWGSWISIVRKIQLLRDVDKSPSWEIFTSLIGTFFYAVSIFAFTNLNISDFIRPISLYDVQWGKKWYGREGLVKRYISLVE